MWISEPTPVTTRIITAESGSSRKAASALKFAVPIQVNRWSVITRASAGSFVRSFTSSSEITNAATTEPHESAIVSMRLRGLRKNASSTPCTTAPISGSRGTQRIISLCVASTI
jgi:hypothetical protein